MKLFVGTKHRKGISYGERKEKRRDRTTFGPDSFFNLLMGPKWARDILFNQNFILTFLSHTLALKYKIK
jgi:hypothetical protein